MLKTLGRGMSVLTTLSAPSSNPTLTLSTIPGYYADYDAADLSTSTIINGNEVAVWGDVSGNGNHLDNPSSVKLRAYERTIEGVPALANYGAASISRANFGIDPSTDDFTIFCVAMVDESSNDIIWGWDGNVVRQIIYSGLASNVIDNGASFNKSVAAAGEMNKGGISVFAHDPATSSETRHNKAQTTSTNNVTLSSTNGEFVVGSAPFGNTNNAIKGAISRIIVFNRKLNLAEIEFVENLLESTYRIASLFNDDVGLIAAGQSNIHYQFTQSSGSGAANTVTALGDYYGGTIRYETGAQGGAAVLKENASGTFPDRWYYDNDTGDFGPTYDGWATEVDAFTAAGIEIDAILWDQGEEDAGDIGNSNTERTKYKEALKALWTQMRVKIGRDVPIIITPLGRNNLGASGGGWQRIREVQYELSREFYNTYIMSGRAHYGLSDNLHLDQAGREALGTAQGHFVGQIMGRAGSVPVIPPAIASVSRSGTSVTITIEHREGSDFTPASGIDGFVFSNNGYEGDENGSVIPWAVEPARTNATTITGTLASTPSGDEYLVYQSAPMNVASYGGNVVGANMVVDNSTASLPLAPGVWRNNGAGFEKIAGG